MWDLTHDVIVFLFLREYDVLLYPQVLLLFLLLFRLLLTAGVWGGRGKGE